MTEEYSWNGTEWAIGGKKKDAVSTTHEEPTPCRYCGKPAASGVGFHLACLKDADRKKGGDRGFGRGPDTKPRRSRWKKDEPPRPSAEEISQRLKAETEKLIQGGE